MKLVSYKFIDSHGNLRDKIVTTAKLSDIKHPKATWFDGSSFGFTPTNNSDLLLVPDQTTKHYDPIRDMDGVMCFLQTPDKKPLESDFRTQAKLARDANRYSKGALFGVEPEFFILAGTPDKCIPFNESPDWDPSKVTQYEYYGSLPPTDKTQEVRNAILNNLSKIDIEVESCHHEVAPGQAELSWMCADILTTCDNMMLAKYIISATVAQFTDRYGNPAFASFDPKPFENLNGNGCHVHQSVPGMDNQTVLEAYAQGLVDHYDDLLKVCNVHKNSQLRLQPGFEAPTKENNGFGYCDRTKTIRIPADQNRVEFRLPDPCMNPYVALPKMLKYGIESILKNLNDEATQ